MLLQRLAVDDVTSSSGLGAVSRQFTRFGMGWVDFNNDGRSDIYVSNMFSSAGNRITHQQQFKTGLDAETKKHFQRHARGNSLFENAGDGKFHDRSVELGITLGRWAWGSLFADINNDGWEDLYVTNGFITADTQNDL